MGKIIINKGVCTLLKLDLTEFDFTGIAKLVLTFKNSTDVKAPVLIEREFTEAKEYDIVIKAEESLKLNYDAVCDFDIITVSGDRFKESENYKVVLREGVGDCIE